MSGDRQRLGGAWEIALLLGIALSMGALGLQFMRGGDILFLDRPRELASEPDFLLKYLRTTGAPMQFERGFVSLPASKDSQDRLYGLLSALGTYLDVLMEDRRRVLAETERAGRSSAGDRVLTFERRFAEPDANGRLVISRQAVEWNEVSWQEMDQLLFSLEGQYRAVAEALKVLEPGSIVPAKFTPMEKTLSIGTTPSMTLGPPDAARPSSEVELITNEIESPDPSVANQGQSLAN